MVIVKEGGDCDEMMCARYTWQCGWGGTCRLVMHGEFS